MTSLINSHAYVQNSFVLKGLLSLSFCCMYMYIVYWVVTGMTSLIALWTFMHTYVWDSCVLKGLLSLSFCCMWRGGLNTSTNTCTCTCKIFRCTIKFYMYTYNIIAGDSSLWDQDNSQGQLLWSSSYQPHVFHSHQDRSLEQSLHSAACGGRSVRQQQTVPL